MGRIAALVLVAGSMAVAAWAHPGAGLVIDGRKYLYFTDTGAGIWEASPNGSLRLVSRSALHWMAAVPRKAEPRAAAPFELVRPENSDLTLVLSSDVPIAAAPDGSLAFAGKDRGSIVVRHGAREEAARMDAVNGRSRGIMGLTIAADGAIWMIASDSEERAYSVRRVSAAGEWTTRARNFLSTALEREGDECRGIACAPSGMVYVAATAARSVVAIDAQGAVRTVLHAEPPWAPTAVAVDGEDLYVLEYTDGPPGADGSDRTVWIPRVRRVRADGRVDTVAEVRRQQAD